MTQDWNTAADQGRPCPTSSSSGRHQPRHFPHLVFFTFQVLCYLPRAFLFNHVRPDAHATHYRQHPLYLLDSGYPLFSTRTSLIGPSVRLAYSSAIIVFPSRGLMQNKEVSWKPFLWIHDSAIKYKFPNQCIRIPTFISIFIQLRRSDHSPGIRSKTFFKAAIAGILIGWWVVALLTFSYSAGLSAADVSPDFTKHAK